MDIKNISLVFNSLSQENRLKIFRILVENSKTGITPTEIAYLMNKMPKNTLSFHLNILMQAGLCSSERNGKQIIYKPVCSIIQEVAKFLLQDCCDKECN